MLRNGPAPVTDRLSYHDSSHRLSSLTNVNNVNNSINVSSSTSTTTNASSSNPLASGLVRNSINRYPNRPLRFRTHFTNTILDVFKMRGYRQTDGDLDWDIHWADVGWIKEAMDMIHLDDYQRVNHFRNHFELTRKDLLVKNVKRMKKFCEKEGLKEEAIKYDAICPLSYVLPAEYSLFAEEFKRNPGVYIMKPVGKSQGKGIFLFNKLNQISEWKKDSRWREGSNSVQVTENYIVQKYVDNPYLIGGKKFDLRLYALVTSFNPLTVYLYRSGFARFTFHRFSMNLKELDNSYIHLTNVAVQKTSDQYDESGCKWFVRNLKLYLYSKHQKSQVDKLFQEIQELILRTLLAVQKVMIHDKHCFEMYGYDILIDADLKPWLLEVNASPSLTADTQSDYNFKIELLNDMLNVIDLEKKLTGKEERVGGFDLICKGVPDFNTMVPTLLGCHNDREKQLKKLYRAAQ